MLDHVRNMFGLWRCVGFFVFFKFYNVAGKPKPEDVVVISIDVGKLEMRWVLSIL